MQFQSITKGTPEWNYSQFRLQLILSHPNIQILSVQKNQHAEGHFEGKQNFFKIDAAIDVTEQKENEIYSLKNNNKKGSTFRCGRIQQQPRIEDATGNIKTYRIIFFKIAVKNMLPIYESPSISKSDMLNFLQDYDSIYLSSKKQQITVYDHRYFLRSTTQYVWEYDIEYKYLNSNDPASKVRRWDPEQQICQSCAINKGYWHCVEEKQTFCRDCFDEAHFGKFRKSHHKEHLNPFNCHKKCLKIAHNQCPLEFYCFNCRALKCSKCLTDQTHSINQSYTPSMFLQKEDFNKTRSKRQNHEFAPIRDLIKVFQEKEKQINSQLKEKFIVKIKQVETLISQRSIRYQQKLKQIEQNLTQSILKLKKAARIQINEAVTLQVELKRKFDEILWIQKFVSYNEETIDAESNIQLKLLFTEYVAFINPEEYFKRIQQKITQIKGTI